MNHLQRTLNPSALLLLALIVIGFSLIQAHALKSMEETKRELAAGDGLAEPVKLANPIADREGRSQIEAMLFQEPVELHILLVELRPYGFIPAEVTVAPGKYLIDLQNRSGKKGLSLRLERESGSRLSESQPPYRDWKTRVVLSPGTYILSEASELSWRCVIHVTNP